VAGLPVDVRGLKEFRRDLANAADPKAARKELTATQRLIAQIVAGDAKRTAGALGGPFLHFRHHITGYGRASGASVGLRGSKANATFWGAKKHTGALARAGGLWQQHPEWVGNSGWQVGGSWGGPYAINQAIHARIPWIEDQYLEAIDRLAADAFPRR